MKLIDALAYKENPFWIPDVTRDQLPQFFKELGFQKGVEIGVSWGQNIVDYCEAGLQIYGVDPWQESEDNIYRKIISIPGEHARTIEDVYKYAVERTSKYPNCTLIRKTSLEALQDFPGRSLDFVYIDANHDFGYIAMDLMKWSQKVKKGGIIAGHDYYSTKGDRGIRHVGNIVDAFAKSYDFDHFYVLGRKNEDRDPDEKFDRELSYMFIKHW
jgi:hypothetical protein